MSDEPSTPASPGRPLRMSAGRSSPSPRASSALVMVVVGRRHGCLLLDERSAQHDPARTPSRSRFGLPAARRRQDIARQVRERACNYLLLGSDSRKGLSARGAGALRDRTRTSAARTARTRSSSCTRGPISARRRSSRSRATSGWTSRAMGRGRSTRRSRAGSRAAAPSGWPEPSRSITGMQIHHVLYVSLAGFERRRRRARRGATCASRIRCRTSSRGSTSRRGVRRSTGPRRSRYVRTRHQPCDTIPDFARIGRQQQFLRAVISKLLEPSELLHLPQLVPAAPRNLVVDEGLNPPSSSTWPDSSGAWGPRTPTSARCPAARPASTTRRHLPVDRADGPAGRERPVPQPPRRPAARRPGDATGRGRRPRPPTSCVRSSTAGDAIAADVSRHPHRGRLQHLAGRRRRVDPSTCRGRDR